MPEMVDTPHVIFAVDGAERVGEPCDLEEAGILDWFPLRDIPEVVRAGKIAGWGSLVALLRVLALGRESLNTT
jgi:hypothetical protein